MYNPFASPLYVAPNDTVAIPPDNQTTQNTYSVTQGSGTLKKYGFDKMPPWAIALMAIGAYKLIVK